MVFIILTWENRVIWSLGRHRKTAAREDRWIGNESKKDRFSTATATSKRVNANFGIKIPRHTISRRRNEINLKSRVACTKLYISKKNKWTEEQWDCVPFCTESKFNLFFLFFCFFVTGEGSFDAVLRNEVRLILQKAALNLEEEVWSYLALFLLLVQDLLWGYRIKLMRLNTKRYWGNVLYLIWELQLINQLYLCKITLRVTQRSL